MSAGVRYAAQRRLNYTTIDIQRKPLTRKPSIPPPTFYLHWHTMKPWHTPDLTSNDITSESIYLRRRELIAAAGLTGIGLAAMPSAVKNCELLASFSFCTTRCAKARLFRMSIWVFRLRS
mgnify:CR=1 FL=1